MNLAFVSQNPATGELIRELSCWDEAQLEAALVEVAVATPKWANTPWRAGICESEDGVG